MPFYQITILAFQWHKLGDFFPKAELKEAGFSKPPCEITENLGYQNSQKSCPFCHSREIHGKLSAESLEMDSIVCPGDWIVLIPRSNLLSVLRPSEFQQYTQGKEPLVCPSKQVKKS